MSDLINMHEASITLGLPEFLIRDFIQYGFNKRKLQFAPSSQDKFSRTDIIEFQKYLDEPWDGEGRLAPPAHIERYLKYEAQGKCAFCGINKPNYEYAHVRSWTKTRCNSPHNLLYFCLDCHTTYGNDEKLLQGIKEECLRRIQIIDLSLIYECDNDINSGDAVYAIDGRAYRATLSNNKSELATGFISTKISQNRCLIQRNGVISIGNLIPGFDYCLSPYESGKVIQMEEMIKDYDLKKLKYPVFQVVGRAESKSHLVIRISSYITMIDNYSVENN
jgi:hypothetical protein